MHGTTTWRLSINFILLHERLIQQIVDYVDTFMNDMGVYGY
ncbi:MAG TPA: hypothetical protein PKH93_11065 [Chitinophagales bacterium]|nr:hypothetical protein [Chitinophagales bacterium]